MRRARVDARARPILVLPGLARRTRPYRLDVAANAAAEHGRGCCVRVDVAFRRIIQVVGRAGGLSWLTKPPTFSKRWPSEGCALRRAYEVPAWRPLVRGVGLRRKSEMSTFPLGQRMVTSSNWRRRRRAWRTRPPSARSEPARSQCTVSTRPSARSARGQHASLLSAASLSVSTAHAGTVRVTRLARLARIPHIR